MTTQLSPDRADEALPDLVSYRRARAHRDLYGRSLVGPIFYAIGCIVTCSIAGYYDPLRPIAYLSPAAYLVFFVLRRVNRPPTDVYDVKAQLRWRARHWALIHAGCLLWAFLFVYVTRTQPSYDVPFTIAVVCSVMYGTSLSQAFAMDARQTVLTLTFLFLPALALFVYEPALRPIGVVIAVYATYLFASLRRFAVEYEAQIKTEYALVESRAEIEKLTRVDALTGLANRREYEHAFPQVWHHGMRQKTPLALLVLDIDHFKRINDEHGHLAGDACLKHFATLMRKQFRREIDLVARIGGEEFVVVLVGASITDATRLADRFREELETTPCLVSGKSHRMTVSIGAGTADWSTDAKPDATFSRVDAACYEAKTAGRNRVTVAASARAELTSTPPLRLPSSPGKEGRA